MRTTRTLLASCGIFAGAVLAHVLGSGSLHVGNSHFLFMLLIALAAVIISKKSLAGPKLAMVIALAQFGTHFFFSTSGNAASGTELRMALSHLILGLTSYFIIVQAESILNLAIDLLDRLVVVRFKVIKTIHLIANLVTSGLANCISRILALDLAQRGPPVITN